MSKVNNWLRKTETGYAHWCPGCDMIHILPKEWWFNGDFIYPSFSPSFKDTESNGKICHYVLVEGILHYTNDTTHKFKGRQMALPELPEGY
jgi:hypothetical protein